MSAKKDISRRGFMAAGAAALLAGGPTASCMAMGVSPRPAAKMRFGLVTWLWAKDWNLPTLIANCEKSGLLGVELRTTHAHGVERDLTGEQRRRVRERFAESRVELVGIGSNERFDSPDPEKLAASIEATKAFVKLSRDVGGSGVKVKPDSFHEGVPREKTIEQIGESLHKVAAFAADYGQQIRLEVHGGCAELPTIKAIIEAADHPNARVCWNSNRQDLAGAGLEYNFNLVRPWFGDTAHVRELNDPEYGYPYPKLIELLVKIKYKGWVLLEAFTKPADRVEAMKEQKRIFEEMTAGLRPAEQVSS